jgi:hypothetical protein
MGSSLECSCNVKIEWTWRGIVAVILALGAAIAVILLIVETILHAEAVTSQEATVISTSLGAMIGAVAVYLGGHTPDKPDGKDEEPPT